MRSMVGAAGIPRLQAGEDVKMDEFMKLMEAAYAAGQSAEREACAKVCDEVGDKMGGSVGAYDCAAAIRSRTT